MTKAALVEQLCGLSRANRWQIVQFLVADLARTEPSGLYAKAETGEMALKEAEANYQAPLDEPLASEPAIKPDRAYTFSDFFALNLPTDKIVRYFGYRYQRASLPLPTTDQPLDRIADLRTRLKANLLHVNLNNEASAS